MKDGHRERGTRKRRAIIVCGSLALLLAAAYFSIMSHYQRIQRDTLFESNDLRAALVYYAEDHCGRLPDAPARLLELPYVVRNKDGTISVIRKPDSEYYPQVYRVRIQVGWENLVNWGADAAGQGSSAGMATNGVGADAWLLGPVDGSDFARELAISGSKELGEICEELREACAIADRPRNEEAKGGKEN